MFTQHLRDGEDDVRRGRAGGDLAGEFETDDARDQHGNWLAEHGCLGFNTTDTPAEYAQTVDHRGVGIGADAGIRVGERVFAVLACEHGAREVFDVDLVDDTGARWDDAEVFKGSLSPAQELVALTVTFVFLVLVGFERLRRAVHVDLHGVVNNHFRWRQRIDFRGVAAQVLHCFTHGGQVDDAGNAGEVLHGNARRGELDFGAGLCFRVPASQRVDLVGGDVDTVFVAQKVFSQDLQ